MHHESFGHAPIYGVVVLSQTIPLVWTLPFIWLPKHQPSRQDMTEEVVVLLKLRHKRGPLRLYSPNGPGRRPTSQSSRTIWVSAAAVWSVFYWLISIRWAHHQIIVDYCLPSMSLYPVCIKNEEGLYACRTCSFSVLGEDFTQEQLLFFNVCFCFVF